MIDISLDGIGSLLTSAREAITGKKILDEEAMAKLDLELAKLQEATNQGQIAVNKIEAAHKSLFVAGWRPAIGWVCAIAIMYAYLLQPLIEWTVLILGYEIRTPYIDSDTLYQLVIAMLGLAGLRTYEKQQKVAREK